MSALSLKRPATRRRRSPRGETTRLPACYSCGTCTSACPVQAATGRLRPAELVHKARLGLYDEIGRAAEIWYCIDCNRCSHLCPMTVDPAGLLRSLRREALARETVPATLAAHRRALLNALPRILWHAVEALLNGECPDVDANWRRWDRQPAASTPGRPVRLPAETRENSALRQAAESYGAHSTSLSACFTCRECSSACPVCTDPAAFEPVRIFRAANLGLKSALAASPALWLCLDCRSCIPACSQGVQGALVIRQLQQFAVKEGLVPKGFFIELQDIKQAVYGRYIREIDRLISAAA